MSFQSQENNMRRLSSLMSRDLGYIYGERECGPNGAKKAFLNLGQVFLRALAKDLGLRNMQVISNPGGIAVSGECCLYGMWVDSGIFICIQQPCCGGDNVFLYRTIRTINDHKGGYNRYLKLRDLKKLSYKQLLSSFSELRKDGCGDGWAA